MGVWGVGVEVMLSVRIGFEHAVYSNSTTANDYLGSIWWHILVASAAAQLLLVGPVHDSTDGVVSVSAIDS